MRCLIACLAALLAAAPGPVRASAVTALEAWGILGAWAPSCDEPPSDGNVYYIWVRRGSDAFLERKGGRFADNSPITDARITPDGRLEYRVLFGSHAMINTWSKGQKGIRIVTNRYESGRPTVEDGRLVHNGRPTPWHTKCVGARA